MHRMKISTKMMLWSVISSLLLVLVCFLVLYSSTSALLEQMLRDDLKLAVQQITAQIEKKQGILIYEEETPIAPEISYYVVEESGSELVSVGEDITLFDDEPFHENDYTRLTRGNSEWLILDSAPISAEGDVVRVRAAMRCTLNQRALAIMRKVFLLCVPPLILLTTWIGFVLTRRSLSPIRAIITSAERIEQGDLSQRIPDSPAQDELGKLTVTLNQMIASLEDAFHREQRFASNASHELRTPVAVIRAYAENLLEQPELNEEARTSAQTILNECRKMQKLIEQMLTLTRAQEGRLELHCEHLRVADTLECVQMALNDAAEEKKMHISADAPEDLMVWADQSLFTQMFVNLTENAIKYGKEGGHIRLQAEQEGESVRLTVSDDGEGIAPEHLAHIFERFYRADSARDRSGSGLGLSIVQWIVQIHGGTISAQSKVGKGTSFIIHWNRQNK